MRKGDCREYNILKKLPDMDDSAIGGCNRNINLFGSIKIKL